jgi:hypothetical protein
MLSRIFSDGGSYEDKREYIKKENSLEAISGEAETEATSHSFGQMRFEKNRKSRNIKDLILKMVSEEQTFDCRFMLHLFIIRA